MSRALAIADSVVPSLPLLFFALVVSASTGTPMPFVLALAATGLLVVSTWPARGWWQAGVPGLALFLVRAGTVLDTTVVNSEAELHTARFGLPLDLVEAELSANPPLPYRVGWDPWEDPARLLPARFVASYALVLGGLSGVALAIHSLTARRLRRRTTGNGASSAG